MFDMIAAQYPRLTRAMRRAYGMTRAETGEMIFAARFPNRGMVWTAADCERARAMIANAVSGRVRGVSA